MQFMKEADSRRSSEPRERVNSCATMVYGNSLQVNSRQVQPDEEVVRAGPVKVEDKASALKGAVLLKDRFAVLCPSRLLLFKS